MGKRFWSLALSIALVGGVFSAVPAMAQAAPATVVPAIVNIEDPLGDANYINDQGVGAPLPGDTVLPASAGTVSDILKAWFTSDADSVSAHILTKAAPPASTPLIFHVRVDPGEGAECLWFRASFPSIVQGQEDPVVPKAASLRDTCATDLGIQDGELKVEVTPEENGIITMTFPKSLHPGLTDGNVLKAPTADSRSFPAGQLTVPQIDDTLPGTDFTITSGVAGGAGSPVTPTEPPGKSDPPGKGKKKGCSKGSGQKKGACPGKKAPKPKPAAACPAYVPGEEGAEAETTIVTDAATAEKPVEVTLTADAGLGAMPISGTPVPYNETTSVYQNLQVDSASPEKGLYVRFEFPDRHDYDLYLNRADGTTAANSGDANAAPGEGLGGGSPDGGWEAGTNYEQVMGIRSADCAGYTARMVSFLTNGGEVTLKAWLGDVLADPVAAEGGDALSVFYNMTGFVNPSSSSVRSSQASSTPAADKGCKKGKGKKNGCKKPPVACAPYTPGELGAEQPTVTVTDAHTAEAPLLQPITLDAAADEGVLEAVGAGETPRAVFNVQVDSALQSAGLYVTFEFDSHRDYDLYGYFPDGKVAASSHGFQPAMETNDLPDDADQSNTDSNHGGESTATSENLVGIITPDCGGYTLEFSSYLAEGGDFEVKLWLGEGVTVPGAPE